MSPPSAGLAALGADAQLPARLIRQVPSDVRLSAKERWLAPHEHDEEFQKELFRPVLSIFPGVPKERSFLCRVCKRANEDTGKERIENGRKVLGGAHRGCFGQRLMLPRGSAARS